MNSRLRLPLAVTRDGLRSDGWCTKTRCANKTDKVMTYLCTGWCFYPGWPWLTQFFHTCNDRERKLSVFDRDTSGRRGGALRVPSHSLRRLVLFSMRRAVKLQLAICKVAQMSRAIGKINHSRSMTLCLWLTSNECAALWHLSESLNISKRS